MSFILSHHIITFLAGTLVGGILFMSIQYGYKNYRKKIHGKNLNDPFMQLDILLNIMVDYIYIKDTQSRFILSNRKFLDVFKLSSYNQIIGKTDKDFFPEKMANKYFNDEVKIFKTGKPLVGEIEEGLNEDGDIIFISTSKFPLYNNKNEIIGLVGIGRDVTKLKSIEEDLIKTNEQLKLINSELLAKQEKIFEQSEKLKIQAAELEYNNMELYKIIKTRDQFFSIIAHDLKNPVNVLKGFAELLYYRYDKFDEARKKKYINTIFNLTNNLSDLLINLLHWSMVQSGGITYNPEKIIVKSYIKENISAIQGQLDKKKLKTSVSLDIPDNVSISADRNMIDFIIRNLLTNAVKFTSKGGRIEFESIVKNENIIFCVKDNGIGIAPDMLDSIFEVGNNKSNFGTDGETGTGLGLVLSKDFISKLQGEIWCESEQGKGSKFCISIPVA
ncbi:MAG: PAS domain-containing sensor histidine kinase [Bacteroidales bacterium]|nr:PAS domain-containing sensor histidine kinase [Bacteroidales bacterium]